MTDSTTRTDSRFVSGPRPPAAPIVGMDEADAWLERFENRCLVLAVAMSGTIWILYGITRL
jgi:hypothetical protein